MGPRDGGLRASENLQVCPCRPRQPAAPVLARTGLIGGHDASAAGAFHSNRPVGGVGAVAGADRGAFRVVAYASSDPLYLATTLFRSDVFGDLFRSAGTVEHAARAPRLLRFLWRQSRRWSGARRPPTGLPGASATIPEDRLARSQPTGANRARRIERPSARAASFFLT